MSRRGLRLAPSQVNRAAIIPSSAKPGVAIFVAAGSARARSGTKEGHDEKGRG